MTRKLKFREKLDEFSTNQSSRRKTEISVKNVDEFSRICQ